MTSTEPETRTLGHLSSSHIPIPMCYGQLNFSNPRSQIENRSEHDWNSQGMPRQWPSMVPMSEHAKTMDKSLSISCSIPDCLVPSAQLEWRSQSLKVTSSRRADGFKCFGYNRMRPGSNRHREPLLSKVSFLEIQKR